MHVSITSAGTSIRRRAETFELANGDRKMTLAAQRVESLAIATRAHFTTDAVALAVEHAIDIVILDDHGEPIARIVPSSMHGRASIRRRQLEIAATADGFAIAREWVVARLDAQVDHLTARAERRRRNLPAVNMALDQIPMHRQRIAELTGTADEQRPTLQGLEGTAGRLYFAALAELVPPAFAFAGRSSRPARDPFNALLNYGLGVLYARIERALELAGLDPTLGFLHADAYGRASLACDFIEPWRTLIERAVLDGLASRQITREQFDITDLGVTLGDDAKRALLTVVFEAFDAPTRRHGRTWPQHRIIQADAHALANRLIGRSADPGTVEMLDLATPADWPDADTI